MAELLDPSFVNTSDNLINNVERHLIKAAEHLTTNPQDIDGANSIVDSYAFVPDIVYSRNEFIRMMYVLSRDSNDPKVQKYCYDQFQLVIKMLPTTLIAFRIEEETGNLFAEYETEPPAPKKWQPKTRHL